MDRRRFILAGLSAATGLPAAPALAQREPASLSVREAYEAVTAGRILLIDIRRPEEWADTGVAEGAIRLDMTAGPFEARLAGLKADHPARPIALIDRIGDRARSLQLTLSARGWQGLVAVRGGMLGDGRNAGWLAEKLPLQAAN